MILSGIPDQEIVTVILFTSCFFMVVAILLIVFFYFSRKKIIQQEIDKKNLELQYQFEQLEAVILTQEEERKRIAQDLHDDISSKLNVVSLNCHMLATDNISKDEIDSISSNIINLTAKALDSSRKIAHGLYPPVLEKFGLDAGIEELCEEFEMSKAVKVNYQNSLVFPDNDNERNLHIFRILQELMNNSLRHGKATEINIEFKSAIDVLTCRYSDNGIGFDTTNIKNQKGLGTKNIESRISFLKGTIHYESIVNRGILVIFTF